MSAPRWLKSVGAVLAGFATVVVLSTATDAVLHATGVFPPADQPMESTALFALALTYRGLFTVLGGWITARLAPVAKMKHVAALAAIGLVAGCLGVVAALTSDLGPAWYAIAVAVTGPICAVIGGFLPRRPAKG